MHNTIYLILRAYTLMLYPSVAQVPPPLVSDDCGGAEVAKNADCAVLKGETCQNTCYNLNLTPTCEVKCGMQNCHEYDCYDWRCVADCIDGSVSSCVSGCSAE